jgi:hypothetical protein
MAGGEPVRQLRISRAPELGSPRFFWNRRSERANSHRARCLPLTRQLVKVDAAPVAGEVTFPPAREVDGAITLSHVSPDSAVSQELSPRLPIPRLAVVRWLGERILRVDRAEMAPSVLGDAIDDIRRGWTTARSSSLGLQL